MTEALFKNLAFVLLATMACAQGTAEAPATGDSLPAGASGPLTSAVATSGDAAGVVVVTGIAAPASGGFPAVVTLELAGDAGGAGGAATATTSEGSGGSGESPEGGAASSPVFMDQIGSTFHPPTLLAGVGQTVDFLNKRASMDDDGWAREARSHSA